jgi:predicted ATP-grasp superfamily ATP-dependent carboligase
LAAYGGKIVKSKPRVFVTDGSYPNALAAVRSLGRNGFRVTVGERLGISSVRSISFWSRQCSERFRYPDPKFEREACVSRLAEHFRRESYAAVLPVGLEMMKLFITCRSVLQAPVLLPPCDSFSVAYDKRRTFEHAARLGIPVPRTVAATEWRELDPPLVFKHPQTGALFANTPAEAALRASQLGLDIAEYMAQEYIPGQNGFGYFGFFQQGRELACFMHQRLMQFPKEGGPSVVARAVYNARLRQLGRELLESLCWQGAAMVEFKRSDRNGEFYLMEINPKLWGSLDLAIQSGCNFPVWIAQALATGLVSLPQHYREGMTYQWVIPNGLKCFLRYPEFRWQFLRNLASPAVRTDLRWLDPLPAVAGVLAMIANLRPR